MYRAVCPFAIMSAVRETTASNKQDTGFRVTNNTFSPRSLQADSRARPARPPRTPASNHARILRSHAFGTRPPRTWGRAA